MLKSLATCGVLAATLSLAGCSESESGVGPLSDARPNDATGNLSDRRSSSGGADGGKSADSGPAAGAKGMTTSGGAGGSPGGGGSQGGSRSDGGQTEAGSTDAAVTPADGGSGAHGAIRCGANTCDASKGEACCGAPGASTVDPPVSYSCVSSGGACSGVRMSCDDPGDCGTGEACCGIGPGTSTFYRSLECVPAGSNCTHFCDTSQLGQCSAGMTCSSSTFMPAYSICKN